jgi:type IV secretory pathway VirB10-like protein
MAVSDLKIAAADESSVLASLDGPPSLVARRERPWGMMLGVGAIAVIALIVFSSLSQDRQAHAQATLKPAISAMPAVPAMASFSQSSPPAPVMQPTAPSVSQPTDPGGDPNARWKAPAMVVDLGEEGAPAAASADTASVGGGQRQAAQPAADSHLSADERFDERIAGSTAETTRATRLRDTALIAPQGTVIPAVMETAINLDLPGYVRAVVSRDVRGFDGSTVLIPRGSRLIGQYRAGVAAGQSRAFVVWSRVLTPDAVSVDIASPGADRLGRSGLDGETNTHFFRRFGNSILLSVLSAGLQAAATNGTNGTAAIVIGSQQQATNIASIALQKEIDIPDTITVAQGTPIRVFIARDLDFSGVAQKKP